MAKSGLIVTRKGFAEIVGVSMPTVSSWLTEGMPVVARGGRGRAWKIDTAVAIGWVRERDVELSVAQSRAASPHRDEFVAQRARLMRLKADQAELEARKRRGELLEYRDVVDKWRAMITTARNQLRAIPKQAAVHLGLTRKQARALLKLIDEALHDLATSDGLPASAQCGEDAA